MSYPANSSAANHANSSLLLALACTVAISLGVAPTAHGLADDASQPIHIKGDDAQIDQANETIVYTGDVQIVQGTLRVNGERMVVKVSGDQVERITTTGAPARYQQQLDNNQGNVQAEAQSIIYHTGAERVYLNGEATLVQKGNRLSGESIRYDIVNGRVDASAGESSGPVEMTLNPAQLSGRRGEANDGSDAPATSDNQTPER